MPPCWRPRSPSTYSQTCPIRPSRKSGSHFHLRNEKLANLLISETFRFPWGGSFVFGRSDANIADQPDSSAIAVGLNRFTAFHHMKFDPGGGRTRWRDVNCTKQEILKVECEKPNDSTRQFFSPTHNLMPVRKIPLYLPNTFSVFSSKCRSSWVFDYFESCFIGDLKSVAYQRRFEIAAVDCDIFGRKFWQWRLCGKRLVAINRHSRQRFRRTLRMDTR
jgi:hypothetical protein